MNHIVNKELKKIKLFPMFVDDGRFVEVSLPEQIFDDPQDRRAKRFLNALGRFEPRERSKGVDK